MGLLIAICDDDKVICGQLKQILENRNWSYKIDIYYSGEDLLKAEKEYDIIFLDIVMEQIDGLKTANLLREQKRDDFIIFLTSHSEFMSEAFKVRAFRFLNKPINMKQFTEALSEVEREVFNNKKVIINYQGRKNLISYKKIIYIEALGDETCIYSSDEEYVTSKSLKYWKEDLGDEHFFCIHKTYIVGMQYVKRIYQNKCFIGEEDIMLPIARRRRTEFQHFFLCYVKKNARSI